MRIHQCARCEGCGYVTGAFRWEIPWSRWANGDHPPAEAGVFEPRPCPDCAGTGALIEMDASAEPGLASRRGVPRNAYAQHVAFLLQSRNRYQH
jgi:hypothetical protein